MGSNSDFEAVARLRREEAALDERLERVRAEARRITGLSEAEAARIAEEARRALEAELASLRGNAARKLKEDLAALHEAAAARRAAIQARAAQRRERAIEHVISRVMP